MIDDGYKQRGLRQKLVKKLDEKGIKDERVLAAINKVPRHAFFENALQDHAYQDKAFPIGEGQTISQPYTVAFQTEKMEIKPGDKVLEIGTGSGYQACVLLEMGARAVLMKGGHLPGDEVVDILVVPGIVRRFTRPRLNTRSSHGTGCTLSAAITAGMAHGNSLERATEDALDYVYRAMAAAPRLGVGHGPLNHRVPAKEPLQ